MKLIKYNSTIFLFGLFVLISIGFIACNADDEVEVIPKTLEEYKAELSAIVSSEKIIVQNCVVGYNKGDFKTELLFPEITYDYIVALMEAEQVLEKADLTIADIFAANKAITPPGKAFNDNIWTSDRRPIHERIIYCDTLRVHTPEGFEVGMCPPEPRNAFIEAISKAKSVRSASSTIERQVIQAVDELNLALGIFEEAIIK